MNLFTDLSARVAALSGFLPVDVSVDDVGHAVCALSDADVVLLASQTAQARQLLEHVSLATSAVINARSSRTAGRSGLAQSLGHRTPAELIQQVAGVPRGMALQQIRVGEALLGSGNGFGGGAGGADALFGSSSAEAPSGNPTPPAPWHAPLASALRGGILSSAQHDAITRGLGEPPVDAGNTLDGSGLGTTGAFPTPATAPPPAPSPDTIAAWSLAAEQLISHSAEVPVEELAKQARAIRDLLDPEGVQARFMARYAQRSFRMWTDSEGLTHGRFVFDDVSAEWVRTMIDSALRPRRGGPRFVTATEQAAAKKLRDDPRSNEQLTHDLLVDVLTTGAVADAATVFGVRQAGIKLVQVVDRDEYLASRGGAKPSRGGASAEAGESAGASQGGARASQSQSQSQSQSPNDSRPLDGSRPLGPSRPPAVVTQLQESGIILPNGLGEKHRCNTGSQPIVTDTRGNPLDVGREQRLFTSKQRVALALRDGGCRWIGCTRPASYCEAHHIDHWQADEGSTDIDRGISLCSFHHLQLHNNGWKITRDGLGPFLLHPPPTASPPSASAPATATQSARQSATPPSPVKKMPGQQFEGTGVSVAGTAPVELRPPLPLSYAWQHGILPAKRFHTAA